MKPRKGMAGVVDNTAALALLTGRKNYQVEVRDVGVFEWVPSGTPDGSEIFAGSIGYWSKMLSSGGGAGSSYAAPKWLEEDGDMTEGEYTFQDDSLIGATQMNFIIVNNNVEFITVDYTFDGVTGTITRVNAWQVFDEMVTPHKPA